MSKENQDAIKLAKNRLLCKNLDTKTKDVLRILIHRLEITDTAGRLNLQQLGEKYELDKQ